MTPLTIIAEAAQGYEGDATLAQLLVKAASAAGADAVKFQMVFADDVVRPTHPGYAWYKKLEMGEAVWEAVKASAHEQGLELYLDLSGAKAMALATRLRPDGVKIHSANFFDHQLLTGALREFPRVLVSLGGITIEEVEASIARHALARRRDQLVFLFGFQAHPTPVGQTNLSRLPVLMRRLEEFEVGFMDHADGVGPDTVSVSLLARALGARWFEKHLTLERERQLEDHVSALDPSQFGGYVRTLRRLEAAWGSPDLALNEAERAYRHKILKRVLAARDLAESHTLTEADVVHKRPDAEADSDAQRLYCDTRAVIGRRLARSLRAGEPLAEGDLR